MLDPKNIKPGQEQFEEFIPLGKKFSPDNKAVQYDYRHTDGDLFSTVAKSLAQARERRDRWILLHAKKPKRRAAPVTRPGIALTRKDSPKMYVYIRSEPHLYTVGFYDPTGKWHAESDHESTEAAAQRVHWLNGGRDEEISEADAMFLQHQQMKEAMNQ